MKFESISSKKFEQFTGHSLSNLHMVIGGWQVTTNLANQPLNMVDRYETHTANGGDGVYEVSDNRVDHWD